MTRTFGALRLTGVALFAGLALGVSVLATASLARATPSCDVKNARSRVHFASLQAAVDAASAGDLLRVSGVCVGTTVVDRKLVIRGVTTDSARPVLDGGRAGRVLEIGAGVTVRLAGLIVRHGRVSGDVGGGILSHGKLTLTDVTVLSNRAPSGGGIYTTGELVLNGTTTIKHNRATVDDGGGIYVDGGSLTATGASAVHHNSAARGAGGIYGIGAVLTLEASTAVHHNRAVTGGGGIYADFDATLDLRGAVSVHDNVADENGGGVFDNSSVAMHDQSTIENNTANKRGGGVYVGCSAELTGADAGTNVRDNHRTNVARETGCS